MVKEAGTTAGLETALLRFCREMPQVVPFYAQCVRSIVDVILEMILLLGAFFVWPLIVLWRVPLSMGIDFFDSNNMYMSFCHKVLEP